MYITSSQLYQKLLDSNISNETWEIIFSFMWVDAKIKEKSAMWDLIQERLGERMRSEWINYRTKDNSQEFPDFLLDEHSDETWLLEVKTFDIDAGANFDVANFMAYVRSVENNSYRLDADYLIFWYKLNDWIFSIERIRLKKVREICCWSQKYPIKTQNKQWDIYNIRPASWESLRWSYPVFANKNEFLDAIQWTLNLYPKTAGRYNSWKDNVMSDINNRLW